MEFCPATQLGVPSGVSLRKRQEFNHPPNGPMLLKQGVIPSGAKRSRRIRGSIEQLLPIAIP